MREQRFIPARAGNARSPRLHSLVRSVHPRAGGERRGRWGPRFSRGGSSPRGRGTPGLSSQPTLLTRFIPARAGNARFRNSTTPASPVHPRAGGERADTLGGVLRITGSSPRGRGTRVTLPGLRRCKRFIPARAGNAPVEEFRVRRTPVHPRAGGERRATLGQITCVHGSSPRGRGTRRRLPRGYPRGRFIPARAGNAAASSEYRRPPPVHPRAGGERPGLASHRLAGIGSSPRGRGTPRPRRHQERTLRFIPARAGNAAPPGAPCSVRSVHPRAGGERVVAREARGIPLGSSPRGRGTQLCRPRITRSDRFIPARAGNAFRGGEQFLYQTVHPRAGGERHLRAAPAAVRFGSSPRGRGTRGVAP